MCRWKSEKGLQGDFKHWAGKLGGWQRLEQGWGRLWSGHTCLACVPVHVCAIMTQVSGGDKWAVGCAGPKLRGS